MEWVIAGMQEGRSNAFVEAMNGLMQDAKRGRSWLQDEQEFHRHPICFCPSSKTCRSIRSSPVRLVSQALSRIGAEGQIPCKTALASTTLYMQMMCIDTS